MRALLGSAVGREVGEGEAAVVMVSKRAPFPLHNNPPPASPYVYPPALTWRGGPPVLPSISADGRPSNSRLPFHACEQPWGP